MNDVERHTGHCTAATLTAHRLAVLDRAKLVALIKHDQAVAGCVTKFATAPSI